MPSFAERRGAVNIPADGIIKHEDLLEALRPVCALVGIVPEDVYDEPGLVIRFGEVRFTIPAQRSDADKRASDGEWVRDVVVKTDLGMFR